MPSYIVLCKQIPDISPYNEFATFVGRNTIIILAVQNYIIGCILLLANKYFEWPLLSNTFINNASTTIIVLFIAFIPILLINRYLPFMIGRGSYFERILK